MSKFLITDDNPQGYALEDILRVIRNEVIDRVARIKDDQRPEATAVLNNNCRILILLAESISFAEDSTRLLNKSFGPRESERPRIGKD